MNILSYIIWNPDPVAFSLGSVEIRWYSLLWCIGLLSVYLLMHQLFRQQKLSEEQFEPMFIYSFLGILIGARLGHCLFYEPAYFLPRPIEMLLPIRQALDGSWHFIGYQGLSRRHHRSDHSPMDLLQTRRPALYPRSRQRSHRHTHLRLCHTSWQPHEFRDNRTPH